MAIRAEMKQSDNCARVGNWRQQLGRIKRYVESTKVFEEELALKKKENVKLKQDLAALKQLVATQKSEITEYKRSVEKLQQEISRVSTGPSKTRNQNIRLTPPDRKRTTMTRGGRQMNRHRTQRRQRALYVQHAEDESAYNTCICGVSKETELGLAMHIKYYRIHSKHNFEVPYFNYSA
ncbi:unnamed protein product [Orchesella dallaii]|uniref:Uncharacterized protein n=1 Tax=Orchesella dallaii TaxID=48710 RepID=A0ABP1QJD5_9HEXA